MKTSRLLGVFLPQNTKFELKQKISASETGKRRNLFFLNAEKLSIADANDWYKETLNHADLVATEDNVSHWAQWKIGKNSFIEKIYADYLCKTPFWIRSILFFILFTLKIVINYLSLFFTLLINYNYTNRTKNQTIQSKKFVFELLAIAQEKSWKIAIINKNPEGDIVTNNLIQRLYPELKTVWWNHESTSLQSVNKAEKTDVLNSEKLYERQPFFWDMRNFFKQENPDLIIVSTENSEGQLEFFLSNLSKDKELNHTLAVGMSLDIFKQKDLLSLKIKKYWQKLTNSLFIIFKTTLQNFTQCLEDEETNVIDIISNSEDKFLVIKKNENQYLLFESTSLKENEVEKTGIMSVQRIANLPIADFKITQIPIKITKEDFHLSFKGFLTTQKAKFGIRQNYLNFLQYNGTEAKNFTFQNTDFIWLDKFVIENKLPLSRQEIWKRFAS